MEKIVEEIHDMLRSERRARRFGSFMKLIYWSVFLYAWWWGWQNYIQPMVGQLSEAMQQVQNAQKSINDATAKVNSAVGSSTTNIDLSKVMDLLNGIPGMKK